MEFLSFIGWTFLFSVVLLIVGIALKSLDGLLVVGFAAVLAFLWILLQRLDRTERKLDELLKQQNKDKNE